MNSKKSSNHEYHFNSGGRKLTIALTDHALERLEEAGIKPTKAVNQLMSARRVRKKIGRQLYKSSLYGDGSNSIEYWYNAPLLYTISPRFVNNRERHIVVTVTERHPAKFLKKNKLTVPFL